VAVSLPFAQADSAAFHGSIGYKAFLFQWWVHFAAIYTCLLVPGALLLFKLKSRVVLRP